MKPTRAPPRTERSVQREIVGALRQIGLRVVAIPNGGQYVGDTEQRYRMAMAKRMDGEVSGFPDLLVLTAKGPPRCAFLEVKRPKASLSGDHARRQADCHAALAADGHHVAIVRSFDDALTAIKEWGFA